LARRRGGVDEDELEEKWLLLLMVNWKVRDVNLLVCSCLLASLFLVQGGALWVGHGP
jgi:hypothetical protein